MTTPLRPTRSLLTIIERVAAIIEQVDLESMIEVTIDTAVELTGAHFGALGVVDDSGTISTFHQKGVDAETIDLIGHLPTGRGVLGDIARNGRVVRTDDVTTVAGFTGMPQHHPRMLAFLGVPVKVRERIFGNLYVASKPEGFDDDDELVMRSLAIVMGAAIHVERLAQAETARAVHEDRERIARDVHDNVIQHLFAAGLELQAQAHVTADPVMFESASNVVAEIDQSISELRDLISGLTEEGGSLDLASDVRDLVERLSSAYRIPVEVVVDGDEPALRAGIVADLLQIVREAVSNALRHSGASRVVVEIVVTSQHLDLSISDDGVGMELAEAKRGLGLENMTTRAHRAGGTLAIDSVPGEGTRVHVRLLRVLAGGAGASWSPRGGRDHEAP